MEAEAKPTSDKMTNENISPESTGAMERILEEKRYPERYAQVSKILLRLLRKIAKRTISSTRLSSVARLDFTKNKDSKIRKNAKGQLIIDVEAASLLEDPNHEIHEYIQTYNSASVETGNTLLVQRLMQENREQSNFFAEIMTDLMSSIIEALGAMKEEPSKKSVNEAEVKEIFDDRQQIADLAKLQFVLFNLNEAPRANTWDEFVLEDKKLFYERLSHECRNKYSPEALKAMIRDVRRLAPRPSDRRKSEKRSRLWCRPLLFTCYKEEDHRLIAEATKTSPNIRPGRSMKQRETAKRMRAECEDLNSRRKTTKEKAFRWVVSECGQRKFLILEKSHELYQAQLRKPFKFEALDHKTKVNDVMMLQDTYEKLNRLNDRLFKSKKSIYMKTAVEPTTDPPPGFSYDSKGRPFLKNIEKWTENELELVTRMSAEEKLRRAAEAEVKGLAAPEAASQK